MKFLYRISVLFIFMSAFVLHWNAADVFSAATGLESAEKALNSAGRKIEDTVKKALDKADALEGDAAKKIEELTTEPETQKQEKEVISKEKTKAKEAVARNAQQENTAPEQALYPGVQNIIYRSGQDNEPHAIIYYPAFGNEKVDSDLKYFVSVQGADFEKEVEESAPDEHSEKPASYDMWEMTGFYTLARPNPDVVSVTFNIYSYTGGAHGNLYLRCLNYNLKTGEPLEFGDLFQDVAKAVEILSKYCEQKLRKDLGSETDEEMLLAGTAPELNNFLNLALNENNVVVEFQPYQVGPWSIGPQNVIVPLEELTEAGPSPVVWPAMKK